ncbi:L-lactate transporter [Gammaproteobacteria bacterium]|nr:L-lactate transporter [Gammaproteobacteria bacterium]
MLLASLLGIACGASPLPFNTLGFFIGPLQQEFGWSLRDISLGLTIYGVLGALLAPLFGSLADRHGVRPVALGSLAAFGLVFAGFALVPPSLAAFYGLWVLVGLVGIGSTPVTWSRAVNLWFFRRRGLALGSTLVGTSIAAMLLPPLTVWLIGRFGWRPAFPLLALLPLGLALPVGFALFREPRPDERPQELSAVAREGSPLLAGLTLAEARAGRQLWILLASILMIAFAYGGAVIHLPRMLEAGGYTPAQAAPLMSLLGLSVLLGRIGSGLLLDRFWAPLVMLPLLALPAVACVLLMGQPPAPATAALAVVLLGLSSGAETDLIAYLAGRYFGMAHYGKIYGFLYMGFALATAASPAAYGWVRDATGSYDRMLATAAVLFVGGALLLLGLGRYPPAAIADAAGWR